MAAAERYIFHLAFPVADLAASKDFYAPWPARSMCRATSSLSVASSTRYCLNPAGSRLVFRL